MSCTKVKVSVAQWSVGMCGDKRLQKITSQVIIVCSNRKHDGAKWRSRVGSTILVHFGETINSCWLRFFGIDVLVHSVIKTAIVLQFSEETLQSTFPK